MPYTPRTWANGKVGGTPINATSLNALEAAVAQAVAAGDSIQGAVDSSDAAVAAAVSTTGTATRVALDAAYSTHDQAGILKAPRSGADWGGSFTLAGGVAGSWDATTYDGWIAGIDAALGTSAVKADLGAGSDIRRVFSYTAGNPTAPHALILSGTHPIEMVSAHAAMRFFISFATSSSPAMKALRSRLRVTWIPTLAPSGYRTSRTNTNGVDVNRNGDFFWRFFDDSTNVGTKGASALSEPESLIVKSLLDSTKIACVIDCHVTSTTGADMQQIPSSGWTTANRATALSARSQWDQIYNTSGSASSGDMSDGSEGWPFMHNWAGRYLRYVKGRQNAYAVLFEGRSDTQGSTASVSSAEMMRLYCGFIQIHLAEWIITGQAPTVAVATNYQARLTVERSSTALPDGTLCTSQGYQNLRWNDYRYASGGSLTDRLDVPIRHPGTIVLTIRATVIGSVNAAAMEPCRMLLKSGLVPAGGGDVPQDFTHIEYINVPAAIPFNTTTGAPATASRASGTIQFRVGYANAAQIGDLVHRFQVQFANLNGGATNRVASFQMFAELHPNTDVVKLPLVPHLP